MQSIPYVDQLVQEYLVFRGFTNTLSSFQQEQQSDVSCSFQAKRLADCILKDLIANGKGRQLVETMHFLSDRCFRHLPPDQEPLIQKMEDAVMQLYLVTAMKAGAYERVSAFFAANGELLLHKPSAAAWAKWFALPYLSFEAAEAHFQVYFTKQWAAITETALRNFLSEAIGTLPLPAILNWESDRRQRIALQRRLAAAEAKLAAADQSQQQSHPQDASTAGARQPLQPPQPDQLAAKAPTEVQRSREDADSDGGQAAQTAVLPGDVGSQQVSLRGSTESAAAAADTPQMAVSAAEMGQLHRLSTLDASGVPDDGLSDTTSEATDTAEAGSSAMLSLPSEPNAASALSDSGNSAVLETLEGHDAAVTCCSFSPDSSNIATAAADGIVRIWAPQSLPGADTQRAAVLHCGAPVSALAWDRRAGKLMLVGMRQGKGIKAWHLDTKHMVAADLAAGSTAGVAADASSPDVLCLATSPTDPAFASSTAVPGPGCKNVSCVLMAAGQPESGVLSLWNMRTFKRVHSWAVTAPVACMAFSADGASLATVATDGQARLLDANSRDPVMAWQIGALSNPHRPDGLPSLAWLRDGWHLATLSSEHLLQTWDIRRPVRPLPISSFDAAHFSAGCAATPYAITASPDKSRIALATGCDEVPLIGVDPQGHLSSAAHSICLDQRDAPLVAGAVSAVDWSGSGALLACARNRTALVVDAATFVGL